MYLESELGEEDVEVVCVDEAALALRQDVVLEGLVVDDQAPTAHRTSHRVRLQHLQGSAKRWSLGCVNAAGKAR